jgi:Flp pilus assembly protein TadD
VQEAEAHALKGLSLKPDAAEANAMMGVVLAAKKDYAGAERAFRVVLSQYPQDARMLNNLGHLREEQGRLEEARQFFAAALKSDPNLYKVRENLQRVQTLLGASK